MTSAAGRWRCSSSTSTSARVPAASPSRALRASAQNASWVGVNVPAARAWASAVAPGSAPGLRCQHLQVVVQDQRLAAAGDRPARWAATWRRPSKIAHLWRRRAGPGPVRPISRAGTEYMALPDRDPGVPVDPRGQRQPGRERLGRQRPQRRPLQLPVVADGLGPVADPAVLVLGVGGGEQLVELGDRVDLGIGTQWVRRNRPPSPSTPPFSWAPSTPGWQ